MNRWFTPPAVMYRPPASTLRPLAIPHPVHHVDPVRSYPYLRTSPLTNTLYSAPSAALRFKTLPSQERLCRPAGLVELGITQPVVYTTGNDVPASGLNAAAFGHPSSCPSCRSCPLLPISPHLSLNQHSLLCVLCGSAFFKTLPKSPFANTFHSSRIANQQIELNFSRRRTNGPQLTPNRIERLRGAH